MTGVRILDPRQPGAFRLWLALLVVVDHLYGVHLGLVAVYLFFILSGFWIHRIWGARYRAGPNPYLTFVISRFWRLVPVMACAMALAVLAQTVVLGVSPVVLFGSASGIELLSHVFILGYGQTTGPMILPPAWTLDLEIQFYLLAPVLFMILHRIGALPFLLLGVSISLVSPMIDWAIPVMPYLALFMAGMAASAIDWRPSRVIQAMAAGSALVIIGSLILVGHSQILFDPGDAPATSRLNWLLAIVLSPIALATVWRRTAGPRDAMLGDLSYIVYLIHWPILVAMSGLVQIVPVSAFVVLIMALLASLSLTLWHCVDRPLNSWRARVVDRWVAADQVGKRRSGPARLIS